MKRKFKSNQFEVIIIIIIIIIIQFLFTLYDKLNEQFLIIMIGRTVNVT